MLVTSEPTCSTMPAPSVPPIQGYAENEEAVLPDLPVDKAECGRSDLNENVLEEILYSALRATMLGQVLVRERPAVLCAGRHMD